MTQQSTDTNSVAYARRILELEELVVELRVEVRHLLKEKDRKDRDWARLADFKDEKIEQLRQMLKEGK